MKRAAAAMLLSRLPASNVSAKSFRALFLNHLKYERNRLKQKGGSERLSSDPFYLISQLFFYWYEDRDAIH